MQMRCRSCRGWHAAGMLPGNNFLACSSALLQVGLYHYAIKSLDDFIQKMARGSGMGNVKTIAFFEASAQLLRRANSLP